MPLRNHRGRHETYNNGEKIATHLLVLSTEESNMSFPRKRECQCSKKRVKLGHPPRQCRERADRQAVGIGLLQRGNNDVPHPVARKGQLVVRFVARGSESICC